MISRISRSTPWRLKRLLRSFRFFDRASVPCQAMIGQPPWTSPNVWNMIVDTYSDKTYSEIYEYGLGSSTIWHLRNLFRQGGKYSGVEHDESWYWEVVKAVLMLASNESPSVCFEGTASAKGYDANIKMLASSGNECAVHLIFRPPQNRGNDADGTVAEFRYYIEAINQPCDVVIVDGRSRKACVNYVLDNHYLKLNGLLALFEAGRGSDGWLGYPASSGTSDYQPEVERMLKLGGVIVDGVGVDRWPGLKRRSSLSTAYSYPLEACILINRPQEMP